MQKDCRVRLIVTVLVLGGLILAGCKHKQPPPSVIPEVAIVTVSPERVVLTTELPDQFHRVLFRP